MVQFFEVTWPFWWLAAIVIILRWLHVNSVPPDESNTPTPHFPRRSSQPKPQTL
jgi:hypothetical protein